MKCSSGSHGFRGLRTIVVFGVLLAACSTPVASDGGTDATMADMAIDASVLDTNLVSDVAVDRNVDASSDRVAVDVAPADVPVSDAAPADSPSDTPPPDVVSSAVITIRDLAIYANCQPVIAVDPIIVFWTTDVRGATSPTAVVTSARLMITGSSTITQNLTLDVPAVTLTGGSGTQDQRKTGADMNPVSPCGELCSGATATLVLRFAVDGTEIEVRATVPFGCVH